MTVPEYASENNQHELHNLMYQHRQTPQLASFALHDMRGATHTLQMFLSVLLSEQPGALNDVQRDFVASIRGNVRRLERLADDLGIILEEGNGFSINPKPVDLYSLIEECRREISVLASHHGTRIEFSVVPEGNVELVSDRTRVAQILMNLLDNAVRHAAPGTAVQLVLKHSRNRILLTVTNQTYERLPEDLSIWIAPYVRGASARERSPRGLGLGLTIVSHLSWLLGGTVVMRGRDDNLTIGVLLPRNAAVYSDGDIAPNHLPRARATRNPVQAE